MSKLKAIFTTPSEATEQPQAGKCLLCLFLVCVVASVAGCYLLDDCAFSTDCGECDNGRCNYYVDEPYCINKSGMPVKIYVRWNRGHFHSYSHGYVQNEDTLHGTFLPFIKANLIEIQFLENPASCLVYSEPVQDSLTDMRSWKAYEKGDTIPGTYMHEHFARYFYTITTEHRAMAKKEYCQAPYWMD